MDLSLAKSLASHSTITGFNIYRVDGLWFFHVLTITSAPGDDGCQFSTARGGRKDYKSIDTLMHDITVIISSDLSRGSIPVSVHI